MKETQQTRHTSPRWLWGGVAAVVIVAAIVLVIVAPWSNDDNGGSSQSGAPAAHINPGPMGTVRGPIADTATSHEFASVRTVDVPIDLAHYGYEEQEYFYSGTAHVYDWKPRGDYVATPTASVPYTTRFYVRRPIHPRPDARVVVELVNSSLNYDLPYFWMMWPQLVRDGDIYVGLDVQPNVFDALKRFDPVRYAPLSMPNPLPPDRQACGALPSQRRSYDPNLSRNYENGLAYDIISQFGRTLRSSGAGNPLGIAAKHVYLAGYSRQAMYMATYARFFARTPSSPGAGLWDGYLTAGASMDTGFGFPGTPGYLMGINQCAAPLPAGDPQLKLPPIGVPMLGINTQSDWGRSLGRPDSHPDSNTADDKYADWEIAGASHLYAYEFSTLLSTQTDNLTLKHMKATRYTYSVPFAPTCSYPSVSARDYDGFDSRESSFPIQYVLDAAFTDLDHWAQTGQAPPASPPLETTGGARPTVKLDRYGNAIGGVQLPYVSVPTATWTGASDAGVGALSQVFCALRGTVAPFSHNRMVAIYPTHEAYVASVRSAADRLVGERFLTAADGQKVVAEAEASFVPSTADVPVAPPTR
jgi:Alpha/beta hydrolase domain